MDTHSPACSATSRYFHLQPHYEDHQMMINIWQHLADHRNNTRLHKLTDVLTVPIAPLYKHMINSNRTILSFNPVDESIDDTASLWTLFSHTGVYIMAIGSLIPAGLGIFCCYLFWCQPTILVH